MEEDIETRKINSSFLRDHSYATEGERAGGGGGSRWGPPPGSIPSARRPPASPRAAGTSVLRPDTSPERGAVRAARGRALRPSRRAATAAAGEWEGARAEPRRAVRAAVTPLR